MSPELPRKILKKLTDTYPDGLTDACARVLYHLVKLSAEGIKTPNFGDIAKSAKPLTPKDRNYITESVVRKNIPELRAHAWGDDNFAEAVPYVEGYSRAEPTEGDHGDAEATERDEQTETDADPPRRYKLGFRINAECYVDAALTARIICELNTRKEDWIPRDLIIKHFNDIPDLVPAQIDIVALVSGRIEWLKEHHYVSEREFGLHVEERSLKEYPYIGRVASLPLDLSRLAELVKKPAALLSKAPAVGPAPPLPGSLPPQLRRLLQSPVHSYHLTLGPAGEPMWSYTVLAFDRSQRDETLVARAVNLPKAKATQIDRAKYEYEYEASFDHDHLVIQVRSAGDTDNDISVRMFTSAGRYNFPLCGGGVIAHTWHHNPATSIFILSEDELECARGAISGEPISDPKVMRELENVWEKGAEKLNLTRLPRGVTVYPNWDKFDELLDTIQRDDQEPETDLRISTIAFRSGGAPEDKLSELAERNFRIKVLMTNPLAGDALVRIRNKIRWRQDLGGDKETVEAAMSALNEQITRIRDRKQFTEEQKRTKGCKGDLDFALSSLMPHSFVALGNTFVILGLFLATSSYGKGPMIVIDRTSNQVLWTSLKNEWDARWKYAQEEAREQPDTDQHKREDIVCHWVGTDEAAREYTASQRQQTRVIRDTHVCSERAARRFDKRVYAQKEGDLAAFLKRRDTQITLVTGARIDQEYIQMFISALDRALRERNEDDDEVGNIKSKILCYKLRNPNAAVTNYIILSYEKDDEIVFGWRKHIDGTAGEVFRSKDARLVREFDASFENLCQMSVQVPIRSLLGSADSAVTSVAPLLPFQQKWNVYQVENLLRGSAPDTEIKILITFFVDDAQLFDLLDDLLVRDPLTRKPVTRKMEIIMLSPDHTELLKRRYGIDGELRVNFTWEAARTQLVEQLDAFRRYQKKLENTPGDHGSLSLRTHQSVPTLVSYQIGDTMIAGMLLTRKAFDDGPMIVVKRGEYLWGVIEENYNTCLANSVPYKGTKTE